jgi:hypothetical protein
VPSGGGIGALFGDPAATKDVVATKSSEWNLTLGTQAT